MTYKIIGSAVLLTLELAMSAASQNLSATAANSTWGSALGMAVDAAGDVYVADYDGNGVDSVDRLGETTTLAGTGITGYSGEGPIIATISGVSSPAGALLSVQD